MWTTVNVVVYTKLALSKFGHQQDSATHFADDAVSSVGNEEISHSVEGKALWPDQLRIRCWAVIPVRGAAAM